MPVIIDGKATAARCNAETARGIAALSAQGTTPGLAVVLIGENPASLAYVRAKDNTCRELGLHSRKIEVPADTPLPRAMSTIPCGLAGSSRAY